MRPVCDNIPVSLPLKFAALFAIALALFNGQCVANCLAFPCQTQDDPSLPPCHQHHEHEQKVCAQPAALADSISVAPPLVFLAVVMPIDSIKIVGDRNPLPNSEPSPPDCLSAIPLPLRI
jgi:hypothetical protein